MSGFRNLNFPRPNVAQQDDDDWDTSGDADNSPHNPFRSQPPPKPPRAATPPEADNRRTSVTDRVQALSISSQGQDQAVPRPSSREGYAVNTQPFYSASTTTPFRPTNVPVQPKGVPVLPVAAVPPKPPRATEPRASEIAATFERNQDSLRPPIPLASKTTGGSNASSAKGSAVSLSGFDASELAQRYPLFNASEISAFHQQFAQFDKDGSDSVHQNDLMTVATKAGESYQDVLAKVNALKLVSKEGFVSFESFLKSISALRTEKGRRASADKKQIRLHGAHENITHTINEDEKESFVAHINAQLSHDRDIGHRLPIDTTTMQVFAECKDGIILAKLINDAVPGTIDERVLNLKKLSPFQMIENNNVVINSAKAIGCSVVNIGNQDIMEGREHLILGLIWQIIRAGLSSRVDIRFHPELFRLLHPGETLEEFLKLPTDQILLRWFNYHLEKAGWHRRVANFTGDVKDGENYCVLLNQLAPSLCSRGPLREQDLLQRAEQVLQNADKLGCRKYLTPKTMVNGNPKLNFAFVANLFNTVPGLDPLDESEKAQLDDWLFGSEGDREARAFALWLNSLGVEPFVNNLYDDLSDGLIILQAIHHIHPTLVDWKKVNKAPVTSKFKKVENTNYCMALGSQMNFTLVAIQGSDITDGVKTLILGYVWQLMREHIIQTLKSLSKHGRSIQDSDIIQWANETVRRGGKVNNIQSFKDQTLRTGMFLLDLLNGMKAGVVDYSMVSRGVDDESCKMNAKYAISIARKLGATIFVLPEDIIEVKPKMILTFIGTLMALDKQS